MLKIWNQQGFFPPPKGVCFEHCLTIDNYRQPLKKIILIQNL